MTVALTGASGYVGSIIATGLPPDRNLVRLERRPSRAGDIPWSLEARDAALADRLAHDNVTDLIHAAWDMKQSSADAVERVCVEGSLALLHAARAAGVRRFVFISTISAFDEARSVYGRAKRKVERAVLNDGGIVLRLGLVHGRVGDAAEGGMLGKLRHTVTTSRFVPMIGGGAAKQYCLDAARLRTTIWRGLAGELDDLRKPVTLADEVPSSLRALVLRIAAEEQRRPVLVPVPWRPVHAVLACLETIGIEPPLRSDSVVSLVFADEAPDFSETRRLRL